MTLEQTIDQAKLEAFVGKGVNDFGAMLSAAFQRRPTARWIDFGAIDALPVGEPRQLTASSPAATTNREPSDSSGGIESTRKAMARYVEPQTT